MIVRVQTRVVVKTIIDYHQLSLPFERGLKGLKLVRKAKDQKIAQTVSIGKFPTGKRDYFFRISSFPLKYLVERTKESCCPFIKQPEFPEIFLK